MGDPLEEVSEERLFPRIDVRCPVLYLPETAQHWAVGNLVNLSAVGLLVDCGERLAEYSQLTFRLEPGSNRVVPPIGGIAQIVRCTETDAGRFLVACKVVRIERPQ